MALNFSNATKLSIEQELLLEEKRYMDLLKADAGFYVVKSLRIRIIQLKAELTDQRMAVRLHLKNQ